MDKEQIRALKDQLREAMRKPPQHIINGSYQAAVNYKLNYVKASKLLNKENPKQQELNHAIWTMTQEEVRYG
jgi:hypothetical protein